MREAAPATPRFLCSDRCALRAVLRTAAAVPCTRVRPRLGSSRRAAVTTLPRATRAPLALAHALDSRGAGLLFCLALSGSLASQCGTPSVSAGACFLVLTRARAADVSKMAAASGERRRTKTCALAGCVQPATLRGFCPAHVSGVLEAVRAAPSPARGECARCVASWPLTRLPLAASRTLCARPGLKRRLSLATPLSSRCRVSRAAAPASSAARRRLWRRGLRVAAVSALLQRPEPRRFAQRAALSRPMRQCTHTLSLSLGDAAAIIARSAPSRARAAASPCRWLL